MFYYYVAKKRRRLVIRENPIDGTMEKYLGNGRWMSMDKKILEVLSASGILDQYLEQISEEEANDIIERKDQSLVMENN